MSKVKSVYTSRFFCTKCGKEGIPIQRRIGQQKSAGHLKKLYCPWCKVQTNHVEIRPFGSYKKEDFEEEFNLGRFIDGDRVLLEDLDRCNEKDCYYNRNGKCWNANHSYQCGLRDAEESKNE